MFCVGLDLGQKRDHSAIAVAERVDHQEPWPVGNAMVSERGRKEIRVRLVERVPLWTPYPVVVERVRAIVNHPELRGKCSLAVDATGVGGPVVDALRAARLGCEIVAVTITGGDREQRSDGGGWGTAGVTRWSVPKRNLIAGIEMLLERGELQIARGAREAGSLARELLDVKATMRSTGRVRIGADGGGEHDDLVIAVALACWRVQQRTSGIRSVRLVGI